MPCGGVPVEMPADERRWLGIEELAAYLGCSRRTAERFLDRTGVLRVRFTGGRRVVVDRQAVDRTLEELAGEQMYDQPEWQKDLQGRLAKYRAHKDQTAGPLNDTPEAGEGDAEPASGDFFELETVETEEAK